MHNLIFSVFSFYTISLHAQIVNIENKRIYDDTSGWSGAIDAGGSIIQNAKVFYSLNFKPRIQYKTRKHYYLFLCDLNYTASEGETFANAGMSHFRYAYRIKNSGLKWESYTQVQYNSLLNQRIRALGGTGLRWKYIDKNYDRGFVGTSLFYEFEELQNETKSIESVRWSTYLSWFLKINSKTNFTGTVYVQPIIHQLKDFRLSGNTVLAYTVGKHLDFKIDYSIFHDQFPANNVRKTVYNVSFGIRYRLNE